jgi:hypothetical protein
VALDEGIYFLIIKSMSDTFVSLFLSAASAMGREPKGRRIFRLHSVQQ